VGDLIRFLVAALAIVAVIRFLSLLLQNLRSKGRRRAAAASGGTEVVLPDLDEQQVVESFASTLSRLRGGGDVDTAILECGRRLVALADESGVSRQPTQTAEEFTVDVLAHTRASAADLTELADLYRGSMFSTHPAGERERARAIACLERLHDALVGSGEAAQGGESPESNGAHRSGDVSTGQDDAGDGNASSSNGGTA